MNIEQSNSELSRKREREREKKIRRRPSIQNAWSGWKLQIQNEKTHKKKASNEIETRLNIYKIHWSSTSECKVVSKTKSKA